MTDNATKRSTLLPPVGSWKYYLLLATVAIFVLGPLGGIAAAYMNFSLGFFIGGQVLAGILGSAVTYGYGAEGKHGANFMQTMAASVASLAAMGVLIQAMVWLGMDLPPAWQLMLFYCCVGMFGVGIGMLYTPILVDRMKLTFPSGLAVANILRALTDKRLLQRSIGQLGGGTGLGIGSAWAVEKLAMMAEVAEKAGSSVLGLPTAVVGFLVTLSPSTVGAGIVVASRIAVPGLIMGLIGDHYTPALKAAGWLGPQDPFRKIGFLIALAMILGAALVDLTLIGVQALRRLEATEKQAAPDPAAALGRPLNLRRLALWTAGWGFAVLMVGHLVLGRPLGFLAFALVLAVVFVLINGISTGISDSNPISSAFVISVLLMSLLGLKDPITALIAASVLLVACSVGVDMQQDRSTGARLGTNRDIQFRFQVIGVVMGSILAVVLAQTFMKAYPVLTLNTYDHPELKVDKWQSAMTFKFVGALRGLGNLPPYKIKALLIGLSFGVVTEVARKLLHKNKSYRRLVDQSGPGGFAFGWLMDAVLLSSPYALSFGGFVELPVTVWYAAGGCLTSIVNTIANRMPKKPEDADIPEDMSTMSLVGGGLVAGESLYALAVGVIGLLALLKG